MEEKHKKIKPPTVIVSGREIRPIPTPIKPYVSDSEGKGYTYITGGGSGRTDPEFEKLLEKIRNKQ